MTEQLLAEVDADKQATYAEKIAKLLRKAEATDSAEEADALIAKAQQLMVTYAIDEQMLAQAQGKQVQDKISKEVLRYTGIFQTALMDIGWVVARANDCKGFFTKVTWEKPTRHDLTLVGFESDLHRVQLLDASLQIQCATQLRLWWATDDRQWMSKMQAFKAKREFIAAFASGAGSKLHAAKRAGRAEAVKHEATRAAATETVASASVELVLRSRQEQVKDYYDETYGKSTRKVTRRYESGGQDARTAGFSAGRNANTGTGGGITGAGKAIGR